MALRGPTIALQGQRQRVARRVASDAARQFICGADAVGADGYEPIAAADAGAVGRAVEQDFIDNEAVGGERLGAQTEDAVADGQIGGQC